MGQKIRPTGFRTGVMQDWKSRWYASKQEFSGLLVEDQKIRKFVKKKYGFAGIPQIDIERTRDEVKVILHTARPGIIIGRKGQEVERLQEELQTLTQRRINIQIQEVNRPEINGQLVAEDIAEQLQKRSSFRRTMKRSLDQTMEAGAKGIKIVLSGRLGGAEMARCEKAIAGSIPLQTLRAKISYGFTEASTAQGNIGVKVWINQGEYSSDEESGDGANAQTRKVPQGTPRPSTGPGDSGQPS
jgi:small subunit ribosomal protein S3